MTVEKRDINMSRSPLKPRFFAKSKAKGGFFSSSSSDEEEDEKHNEGNASSNSKNEIQKNTSSFRLGSLRISKIKKRKAPSLTKGRQQKIKCPRCKIELANIRELTRHASQCKGWEGTQEAMNLLKVDLRPKRVFGQDKEDVDVTNKLVAELEKNVAKEIEEIQEAVDDDEEVVVEEQKKSADKEIEKETTNLNVQIRETRSNIITENNKSEHQARIQSLQDKLESLKQKKMEMLARKEEKRKEKEEREAKAAEILNEKRSRRDLLRQQLEQLEAERKREEGERK